MKEPETDIKEPDELDDKKLKAEENADKKGKEEKKKDKSLSEEERKIADRAADKKISKEDAKKEVARETIKDETGYSANALADVGKKVMHAGQSAGQDAPGKTDKNMAELNGGAAKGIVEKMTNSKVAEKAVQAGLGPEFTSTGASGLEQNARLVLEEIQKYGGEKGMENMLAGGALNGIMTLDQLKQLTPDKLRETLNILRDARQVANEGPMPHRQGPEATKAGPENTVAEPRIPTGRVNAPVRREAPERSLPVPGHDR